MIRSSQRLSEELPEVSKRIILALPRVVFSHSYFCQLKRLSVEHRRQLSQAEKEGAAMAEEAENAWKEKVLLLLRIKLVCV